MPPFFSQHHAVLETIPCDFIELLVGHLYNVYKSKRARKFALPAPPTMQICEGASFPRRLLGLPSWSYRPTCSANEGDPATVAGPLFIRDRSFRISTQLFISSQLCFLLFHALDFTQLLCCTQMPFFQIHHDSLVLPNCF